MSNKCPKCGCVVSADESFCPECGTKINDTAILSNADEKKSDSTAHESKEKAVLGSFKVAADSSTGEVAAFTMKAGLPLENLGVLKTISGGIKQFLSSIKFGFKDWKRLIPASVLFVFWLTLGIMQSSGFNPFPVKMLAFLTFAEAGMKGGFFGAIGGIIGRGIFAGAITSFVLTITRKNKGENGSFMQKIKGAFGFSLETLFPWIFGIGFAIIFLLIMSGGLISRYSFMGGIAAAFLAGKAAINNGFLQQLTGAISAKFKCGKTENGSGFIRGLTSGFVLAAFLGLFNINTILLIIGLVLLVVGLVLTILQKTGVIKFKKEAAKQ